jgi:alkylation response protein AidB-like acyl-CoA dehydrogenase
MYPVLSHGTINALTAHGTEAQKQTFLTRLLSGEWTGTMCLTEPHAGSDVGILRSKAEPNPDGSYAVTGTKIFISAGDHDLAENIVHLVLARLPDSPAGTKGISLFVVPKVLVDDAGGLGERNAVTCGAIEEKMGIHGNATCVLNFDGATGYLLGPENDGMRCMFTMMNAARIVVGVQGLGLMEAAYQGSLSYATERLQMRALSGPKNPDGPADPIIVHPDVRRMLLTQKALVEGGRALAYYTAMQADLADYGPDAASRQRGELMLDFMTPILKAFLTEMGFEATNHAVQVHGGHGFIRETGVEQHVRDSRITLIYEGTTQIQALDLIGRKVLRTQGAAMLEFIGEMKTLAADANGTFPDLARELVRIADEWAASAFAIGARAAEDPDELGAASVDFLMYSGYAVLAYFWLRMARVAHGQDDAFSRGKVATATFYFERLLPRAEAHRRSMEAGAGSLMALDAEAFDHL